MIIINRNLIIGLVIVVILVAGGWYLLKGQAMKNDGDADIDQIEQTASPVESTTQASPVGMSESTDSATRGNVKEFTITGSNFKFDTPEIKVNKGDNVKIVFKNSGGTHNFVIDEFNVSTKTINGPAEDTVTFVADKAGTFEFYCSVGKHRQMGMKGNFIVE